MAGFVPAMAMADIPQGSITLRDDRIGRSWTVRIAPFQLAVTPVTQGEYTAAMGHNPSQFIGARLPVETVSWHDAVAFCNGLSRMHGLEPSYRLGEGEDGVTCVEGSTGYRLPSDAEWEFACRAGSENPRYGELDAIAWHAGNSGGLPHEVGLKQPNALGLYDMLGNVWEWCWDQYDPEVYGSYRVFRGGGWADGERGCLVTNRRRSHPTFAIDDLGFRVARSF